jgi:putative drug exporter of the RND superfamily
VDELAKVIQSSPDVAAVVPPRLNDSGDTAVIVAIPRSSPQKQATATLVHQLRDEAIPASSTGPARERS